MSKEPSTAEQIRVLREGIEKKLAVGGDKRVRLLDQLSRLETELRSLTVDAADAGITTRRMGELLKLTSGGVSNWVAKGRQER